MGNSSAEYDFTSDNRNYNNNCEDMDHSPIETRIRPLIIIGLAELKKDHIIFAELSKVWQKEVEIQKVKFTANDNLLIFVNNEESYNKLKSKVLDYQNKKIEDILPKNFPLVLKNMTFAEAMNFKSELACLGVLDVKEMKSFKNPSVTLKKVKILSKILKQLINL